MRIKALRWDLSSVRTMCAASMLAGAMVLTAGMAKATTIVQFDENFGSSLLEGDIISDGTVGLFDFGGGLTGNITTSDLGSRATGRVQIFDTNAGTDSVGNDPDLLGPFTDVHGVGPDLEFGNALILEEKNSTSPDDAANGGAITFTFDVPVALTALFILDGNDNSPLGASIFLDGNLFGTNFGGHDNEYERIGFAANTIVTTLTIDFQGSGAIGRFGAAVVPIPATLPLLLTGLGAFAWVARRRKKAA